MMKHDSYLPERRIRSILDSFLTSQGWICEVAGTTNHGIDIEAKRGTERWVIETKSSEDTTHDIINSFVSSLGEILQRMDDRNCKYSVALPDTKPFRRLWERLPVLVKKKTGITALFVSQTGTVKELSN